MDEQIRRLARQVEAGNYQDRAAWKTALIRAGYGDPDLEEITAPLTYAEVVQQDFDEIWWHAAKRLRFGWDWMPRGGLVKAHHPWGHRRGHGGENSKRKTLRTHRDGSRRCYKIKHEVGPDSLALSESARRRRKRFGGRAHRQWLYRGEFGPWIFEVDLDE